MGAGEVFDLLKEFGSIGVFAGFLVWDKLRLDAKWRRIEEQRLELQKELEERRQRIDQSRIDADKEMVLALQALTFKITGAAKP